jgi:hypothetical protein
MGLFASPPRARLGDPRRFSRELVAGVTTTTAGPDTPIVVGACLFDPQRAVLPPQPYAQPWIRTILHVTDPDATAHLDIFDPFGVVTGGIPGVVPNSEVQVSSVTPQFIEAALWSLWSTYGVFQARLWVTGPGWAQATCSFAALDFDWS